MNETFLSGDFFEDVVLDSLLRGASAVQHFFFVGRPAPLARQRSAVIKGLNGKQRVIAFSPKQNVFNKNRIYAACLEATPVRWPPPYTIAVKFICEPLKTVKEEYPVSSSHGDLDNLEKLILDAIFFDKRPKRPIPIFQDDRHIVNVLKFKRFPVAGEQPGIHFWMIKHG